MIFVIAIVCFGLGIAFTKYFYDQKLKEIRTNTLNYINSLLGLSISHLHDAANFFGLIKLSINQKDIHHSYNFAKGASFHFRSLFEELKNNLANLQNHNYDFETNMQLLYSKEQIDLKDLLELELFQISNFSRIKFIDLSKSEHAFVHGNFNLLSKTLINLIENAIKYTEREIKIELKNSSPYWLIKVTSLGKEIPRDIIQQIETMNFKANIGHGLSSLASIMNFHDGTIEISSFKDEGSSINLYIKKLGRQMKSEQKQQRKPQNRNAIFQNKPAFYSILFFAIVLFSFFNFQKSNSREAVKVTVTKSYIINDLLNQTDKALETSKDISQTPAAIQEFEEIEISLLSNIQPDKQDLARKLYLSYIYENSNKNLNDYISNKTEGPTILLKPKVHFYIADYEMAKQNFLRSLSEFYKAIQAFLYKNVLVDKDMLIIDELMKSGDFRNSLEEELNQYLKEGVQKSAGIIQGPKSIPMSKPQVDRKTLPPEQNKEDHLLYLIDRRDQELGNEFEF